MADLFSRPALADQMAKQLLNPGVLDEGLRSGLFISGIRRIGKTTFLINDLIPALQAHGAVVIYVDLWIDTNTNPAQLVHAAIQKALRDLQTPGSGLLLQLQKVRGIDVGAFGFKFGFKVEDVGTKAGVTLATALTELVDKAETDVVLIVDEVQHAITSDDGNQLLLALKAARDAINPRPTSPGHFIFIGTGSHRALISELTARRNQAFAGATSVAYPVLGRDYVEYLIARLAAEGVQPLPSVNAALDAFNTLGNRPEEFLKALRQLKTVAPGSDVDAFLPVIASTLRTMAADIELLKVDQLGALAARIFDRIAAADGHARGLFSAEAAADYSKELGREVRIDEIQPVVNDLLAANLIMRQGHGLYGVSDPFVQQVWRERRAIAR